MKLIEEKMADVTLPMDAGRLPHNISSNWGGFTACQWMNWTLVFSVHVFRDILPDRDYQCWHTFVTACRKICSPVVFDRDVMVAEKLFAKFGKQVTDIYGKEVPTPNMHLHMHLSQSIRSYGCVYAFWLFERYNGILSN